MRRSIIILGWILLLLILPAVSLPGFAQDDGTPEWDPLFQDWAYRQETFRLKLTYDLMRAYGLPSLPDILSVGAIPAEENDLLICHTRDYIEILKAADSGLEMPGEERYGLGAGDKPVFEGMFEWSRLVTGASLQASELVDSGEVAIAFNISGGLHHALASRASGFCYINDPVIVISSLLKKDRRVAYIDIDAHHSDGVQEAFYHTDKVLTLSLHESGK